MSSYLPMTKPPVAMTIKTWPVMVAAVKDSRVFTVASTTKGDASSALLFNAASKTRDTTRGIDAAPGR